MVDSRSASTIVEILASHARRQPGDAAYVWLPDSGEPVSLSYEALDRKARRIAAWLRLHKLEHERAVLLCAPGPDYITTLFGCLYAGVIAIPAYPPTSHTWPIVASIVADAGAKALLCGSALQLKRRRTLATAPQLAALAWINLEDVPDDLDTESVEPSARHEAVAYLQYTSGSTGVPKGVMVSHANLAHQNRFIEIETGLSSESVIASWLPPYHDMGLVAGLFATIQSGCKAVLMSPSSFAQRPARWLEAISTYKATMSGAPNFAYDLCVRRTTDAERRTLDLSAWRLAFNGSEQVRADTIERFSAAFAPCGFRREAFYPGYGLAEATLLVSGSRNPGPAIRSFRKSALEQRRVVEAAPEDRDTRRMVGCGRSARDQRVCIVDPDALSECREGEVGEIWVSGPSVTRGYWGRPDETARVYSARCTDADGGAQGPFLRTGDLGFIHGDELFIAGRLKDLLIVRGRNFDPQDIEHAAAQSHPALGDTRMAAFSLDVDVEERLAIAVEVDRRFDPARAGELVEALRGCAADRYGLELHAAYFVRNGTLPRTTSGKIRRQACQQALRAGTLEPIAGWMSPRAPRDADSADSPGTASADAIRDWLVSRIARHTHADSRSVDVRKPFSSYGLDSMTVIEVAGELGAWLGRDVSPTLAYEYPTIGDIARHLGGDPPEARETLVGAGSRGESIAITGMSARFPGAATVEEFWDLLRNGVDAIGEVPADRWNGGAFSWDLSDADAAQTRRGGFLPGIGQFDPAFFHISPREAMCMDPQQRLLLEVAWEALEDAGEVPARLSGSRTGVFVGISSSEYGALHLSNADSIDAYVNVGNALSVAANRISYFLDLRGPSLAVDTACSSSLVAVHLACRSLWSGESTLALVGGANLILSPAVTRTFLKAGAISPDGRCRPFDSLANGIVRSEGIGVLVLKPLSRAQADGDEIYAVILGSAVNQDGRTNGIAAPSREAQEEVLREAYRSAGVSPGEVDYVETHGTGTLLGDPIEAKALAAVLAAERPPSRVCKIGSVKSNIGHTEAAAGVAGLIKVALALKHRELPATLHFEQPNPYIPFDQLPIRVQTTLELWPENNHAIVAGVSAFGFGGTNAHVVLGAAPPPRESKPLATRVAGRPHLLPISARSEAALRALAERFRGILGAPDCRLAELCGAAGGRRDHHDHRLAIVAPSVETALEGLDAFLRREPHAAVTAGRVAGGQRRKLAFVFSGYGGQWWGMGRHLLESETAFRQTFLECDSRFREYGAASLLDEFAKDRADSRLDGRDVETTQIALFSLQVALAALWRSFGIEPDAVVGHSGGEVAAAHVAGVLPLQAAARVCFHRARLLQQGAERAVEPGRMLAAHLTIDEAKRLLTAYGDRVAVATHNGPSSVVLAGEAAALDEIVASLDQRGIVCRTVQAPGAGHSPLVDGIAHDLVQRLDGLTPHHERIPIFSTVTGAQANGTDFDNRYWGKNLRETVLFAKAVDALRESGHDLFLELGPHPLLSGSISESFNVPHRATVLPSLRHRQDDWSVVIRSLGALYANEFDVNWSALEGDANPSVKLPAYPWQQEHFWTDLDVIGRRPATGEHPLLGRRLGSAERSGEYFWETQIDTRRLPYLDDHRVGGSVLFPGMGYVEMAVAAARDLLPGPGHTLSHVVFRRPLFLFEDQPRTVQTVLSPGGVDRATFKISSRPSGEDVRPATWTLHATGEIEVDSSHAQDVLAIPDTSRYADAVDGPPLYKRLSASAVDYGPAFQGIARVWWRDTESLGAVRAPEASVGAGNSYVWHPALLDACLHVLYAGLVSEDRSGEAVFALPCGVERIRIHDRPTQAMWSLGRLNRPSDAKTSATGDVRILDEAGRVVAEVIGYQVKYLSDAAQILSEDPDRWLYRVEWPAKPRAGEVPSRRHVVEATTWLIFEDASGVGAAIAHLLAQRGVRCVRVVAGNSPEDLGEERFRVRPGRSDDLLKPIETAFELPQCPCRIVLHLWSLDASTAPHAGTPPFRAWQDLGCGSLLDVVKELLRRAPEGPPRLWAATRGAQPIVERSGVAVEVAQGPVWGFARSVAQECSNLWGGIVDLDPRAMPEDSARALADEIILSDGEDQIAFCDGARQVARLMRVPPQPGTARPTPWRADGTYLLTGGLGRIALSVGRWMMAQGARRFILMARTSLLPRTQWAQVPASDPRFRQIRIVRELEARGASVHLAPVDVGDEAALRSFFETFTQEGWPPIRGVVHAAGLGHLVTLQNMDRAALEAVLRPKVVGGWLLHQLLIDEPLDVFILVSSFAAVVGSALWSHYAAANASLDALANYRRALGFPALSVNFGAWEETGMPMRFLELAGVDTFTPDQALETLTRLLGGGAAQVAFSRVDWEAWRRLYPTMMKAPMLSSIVAELEGSAGRARRAERQDDLRERLLALPRGAREAALKEYVCGEIAKTLRLPPESLSVDEPITALGIDSMTAIELKRRFESTLQVTLHPVALLMGPTITQLLKMVLDDWDAHGAAAEPVAVDQAQSV